MDNIEKYLRRVIILIAFFPFNILKGQQCNEVIPILNTSMGNEFSYCPGMSTNIQGKVISGDIPRDAEVRWYNNSIASGEMVDAGNITQLGTYYAFYYYPVTNCYSQPSDPVYVISLPDTQVYLNNKARYFGFGQVFNLRDLEDTSRIPVGAGISIKWYSDPLGTIPVTNPSVVDFVGPSSPGLPPVTKIFYVRYEKNCKGPLQAIEIKKIAPFPQVRLYTDAEFDNPFVTGGMGYRNVICEPQDLTELEVPAAPDWITPGTVVRWYSVASVNADSQNTPDPSYWTGVSEVLDRFSAGSGGYSPRYYDPAINYYGPQGYHTTQKNSNYNYYASPRLSTSFSNVPPTPCSNLPNGGEPIVLKSQLTICPGEKADLTDTSIIESWTSGGVNIKPPKLYWYTNDHHGGDPVANPSAVDSGIYYPFYYYSQFMMFRPTKSVNAVTIVEKSNCNECTQPGNNSVSAAISLTGISSFENQTKGWPQNYSAFIVLESKNKGFVITRVAGVSQIKHPIEGMLIYDIVDNNIKLYNGSIWKEIEKSCNE